MLDEVFFAWEGAAYPDGPWRHLRVLEVTGEEAISALYSFSIELVRLADAPEVDVDDLVGTRAALRIVTRTAPESRLIHGVVASAEEIGEIDSGTRYRVVLAPPLVRATMMRKSLVYLDKTLLEIIEAVLTRSAWGAGLEASAGEGDDDDGDMSVFVPATATFALRCIDLSRLGDRDARPYCVQYGESDIAFVSRLLEEEGVSYHFEHRHAECVFVMTDFDGGRPELPSGAPLGPAILGREASSWRSGKRLRPRSVSMHDVSWRKPELSLLAVSPSGIGDFQDHEYPGRYEHAVATGERLAEKREERLDAERQWASAEVRCRLLGAGTVFWLDHESDRLTGSYVVTAIRHAMRSRGSFGASGANEEIFFSRCARNSFASAGSRRSISPATGSSRSWNPTTNSRPPGAACGSINSPTPDACER